MYFNKKLKVLMVIPSFFPLVGGAEKQVSGLVKALGKISCESTILTRLLPNTLKFEEIDGGSVVRLKTTKNKIVFLLKLSFFLLKNRNLFDVIHVHTLNSPAIISSLMGRLLGIPIIIKVTRSGRGSQLASYHFSHKGRLYFYFLRKLSTRFIAITEDVKEELLSSGVGPKKIIQIPNGVNLPNLGSLKKNKNAGCIFVYVGRLIARKRVDWLIKAFSKSTVSSNDRLIIIGSGNEMDSLKKLTFKLKKNHCIEFMGELSHEDVLKALLASNVFILPSNSEGMSNSLLEGMASKNTVIAANIPANRSLIKNNENGLLFSTFKELTEHLNEVSRSDKLQAKLSSNANQHVHENYSFDLISRRYKKAYNLLI